MADIQQVYVFYADYGDYPLVIDEISEREFQIYLKQPKRSDNVHLTTIKMNFIDGKPVIDIVALTDYEKLPQSHIVHIQQQVQNWLLNNGYMNL